MIVEGIKTVFLPEEDQYEFKANAKRMQTHLF